jgi:hypothetical protein
MERAHASAAAMVESFIYVFFKKKMERENYKTRERLLFKSSLYMVSFLLISSFIMVLVKF